MIPHYTAEPKPRRIYVHQNGRFGLYLKHWVQPYCLSSTGSENGWKKWY